MNTETIIIIAIGLVLAVLYCWYAALIRRKNKMYEALSGIDVQFKLRSDLIPNILKMTQHFMTHEAHIFESITQLRSAALQGYDNQNPDAVKAHLAQAEMLSQKMSELRISMENYPTLKSDATMLKAMESYNEVESHIAAARRFYNSAVSSLNNAMQIFPGSLIASMLSIKSLPFFEAIESERAALNVDNFLKS